jgi:hypothetical protein
MAKGELLYSRVYWFPSEATMVAKEQQTNYTVKNVETVAAGKDVQARVFTLERQPIILHRIRLLRSNLCIRRG